MHVRHFDGFEVFSYRHGSPRGVQVEKKIEKITQHSLKFILGMLMGAWLVGIYWVACNIEAAHLGQYCAVYASKHD